MSQEILQELNLFLDSFLIGIIIALVYDGLLILRRVIPHKLFWVSMEDFLFWLCCALAVFILLVEKNDGILRWFAVCGALLGVLLYKKSVSNIYINVMSTILKKLLQLLYLVVAKLLQPINAGKRRIFKQSKRIGHRMGKRTQSLKKRLTVCIKLLKITLCKHARKT